MIRKPTGQLGTLHKQRAFMYWFGIVLIHFVYVFWVSNMCRFNVNYSAS